MKLQGTSLIAGARGQATGRSYRAVNPASGEPLEPEFHEASDAEAARAMEAAAAAFDDLPTTNIPGARAISRADRR